MKFIDFIEQYLMLCLFFPMINQCLFSQSDHMQQLGDRLVFLDQVPSEIILTAKLKELLGSRGENWEILTTGAFVSMTVPLFIFFALQRYFIRGLVAGSVKG